MWKLIVIITAFWRLLPINQEDPIIIILDDCREWRIVKHGLRDKRDFIYSKEFPENATVHLDHTRYSKEPETKGLTISEIEKGKFFYASELDFHDWSKWGEFNGKKNEKVFVMMAEDFCSQKRFEYNYSFTLYEVRVDLSMADIVIDGI
ncbi:hypothetical protein [Algoriphagus sp.]|uniref:hypothetical protein n=1 Tax=Algoriphagus sp. TaxID=1872435 RepID=UPI0025FF1C0B|nr:hypothetical protein [Algoriphagus sp.]